MAKITSCKANLKQVGNMVVSYMAEAKGAVPVLFNYGKYLGQVNDPHNDAMPARTAWLSVAMRHLNPSTAKMPPAFNPELNWPPALQQEYFDNIVPEYFMCPFVRGKSEGKSPLELMEIIQIDGLNGPHDYEVYPWVGRHESYHTWKFEGNIVRRVVPASAKGPSYGDHYPTDPYPPDGVAPVEADGRPKYSALSWNKCYAKDANTWIYEPPPGFVELTSNNYARLNNLHRKWTTRCVQRVHAASLADVTIISCNQGEALGRNFRLYNPGSHRTGQGGGTNVLFGDTHVGWVKGRQVGWY
jgi:prepilin-type processing-associated H-X9-DG protein